MSDPIQNFEYILRKQSAKRPLGLYNANKQPNKHNFKPQDVLSSVSLQLKAIQVADTIKSEKCVRNDLQIYKKSNFLTVNKLPVYDEVPKQSSKFDTQCVSDTQLINIIEDAEMIDVHRGMTQEFETTFSHHTEKQDAVSDDNTNTDVCVQSNEMVCKDMQTVGIKKLKEINKKDTVSKAEGLSESNNVEADTYISIISPIMCSNKIKDREAVFDNKNSIENYTQVEKLSPILNDCIAIEEDLDKSIERPLSPIFMHKNVKRKSKTPSPLIFNLEKFEQFEKIVIPILDSNDLNSAKHVINSQILNKELHLKIDKDTELKERDVLSPVLQNKNVTKHSPTCVGFESNVFKDVDTELEFIELDKATSDDLINKVFNENKGNKVTAESEILKDEILFSSDEEDSYVHKDYQDLPFTCALETSFYDQSDVLDKTMYVGFQTASNKSIQVLTESFAQAKSLLSDVSSKEITVTDLVKKSDSYTKNKTQNDEIQAEIDNEINKKGSSMAHKDADRSEMKLSEKALATCKKVFQDIDFNEKFYEKTEIINTDSTMHINNNNDFRNEVKDDAETKDSKPETNIFDDDIQNIDDAIIQEFENIEMSFEDNDKLADKNEATTGFKTASCKDTNISENALLKIKNVFKDIDFDEDLSKFDMKEINMKQNTLSSNVSDGNFEGFKTASNKKIHISNEAIIKTKNVFQDIDSTEFLNKSDKNLNKYDKPSTSKISFLDFKTANNKDIKISDGALAKTENIFKDIDSTDFKFPIKSDKGSRPNDCKVNCFDQSTTKASFAGFKTANNKDVIISKEALAKTKNIFKDIDSIDIEATKKCSKEYSTHNAGKDIDKFLDFNQPSTSKNSHVGFNTTNNITDADIASTKNIFKDIDCSDFKVQESRVSNEAGMYKIDEKNINDSETISFEPMKTKSKCIGFKTANNRDIKISDAALTKTKNIFKDIDDVKFPSKPNKEEKIIENYNKPTNDTENIVLNKFSASAANYTGFLTANNKKINISEAALSKSRHIFEDIDSIDSTKQPDKVLDRADLIQIKEWSGKKYDMTDFNQPSTSKTSFIGFKTANNRRINISKESLAKTRNIFKDIEKQEIEKEEKDQLSLLNKDNFVLQETEKKEDQLFLPNKANFEGFKTGNNKAITLSEAALAKTKNIFKDIDSPELILLENNKKDYSDIEKDIGHPPLNKANFIGFKTGNNKVINVSELALAKTKNIFNNIDSTEFQQSENNKKDYPDIATDSSITIKSAICKDKTNANKIEIPDATVPKFQGFKTASNKQVKVSVDAIIKSRKIFQDIDVIDSKIEDEQVLNIVNSNIVKDSYIHEEVNNIKVDDTNVPDGSSSPIFKGFQTANKNPVSISKDALAKSKKLFQDIDDFEPEFRGFKTPDDVSSENALTQVKNLLQDKIKESVSFKGFHTASDKKVVVSEEALAKSKNLFRDFDKEKNETEKMTSNIKFGFKTGTNRNIVISEEALSRSKRLFSEIESSNSDHTGNKKDKVTESNIANIIDTQILNNFEESLHTEDFHDTPVKSKRSGSPILSCPKAKRRKKFETPYSQKVLRPDIKKDTITKKVNTITFDKNYKKNKKFTLKDLVDKSTSNTTIDPYLLQFKFDNLLQFEFHDSRNDLSYGNMTIDFLKELFVNSVNSRLIPNGWLDNHLKLILWKLISYEIKFNSPVVCSARNVVEQLKFRYDKELYNAQRPALRKILEKDDVASKTMVLCVAGIFVDGVNETSTTTLNNTELLLTDGWYCIKASLDKMLAQIVCQGKIGVGTKLVTNGAELVNCEQGVSPWEDTSAVRLKIFGNSTRRANWDARLGYHGNGAILSQLSSVRLDGGKVSKLRVYVTRVYPALYVEKFEDGSTVTRSERLEHVHQMKSEAERQAIMEKIYEEVEREFSDQESQDSEGLSGSGGKRMCLDTGSQIAKVLKTSKDPAEFRQHQFSTWSFVDLACIISRINGRNLEALQLRSSTVIVPTGVVHYPEEEISPPRKPRVQKIGRTADLGPLQKCESSSTKNEKIADHRSCGWLRHSCDIEMLSENPDDESEEREQFENQYYKLVAAARSQLGARPPQSSSLRDGSVTGCEDLQAGGFKSNCVRLPKINLPVFQGHYQHWLEFRDTYISLIHSRSDIDNINKLHYLRASLKGSALLVIDNLDFKADNYESAWNLLCNRFDNKRLLVNNHVQALFNIEHMKQESCSGIRHLIDVTNKNLRALSTLDQPTEHWDTLIIHMMAERLDSITHREWEEHRNTFNNPPSLDVFITFLSNRADLLETLQEKKGNLKFNNKSDTLIKHNSNLHTTTKYNQNIKYNTNNKHNSTFKNSSTCPMCNQNHFLFSCESFRSLSIEDRRQKANEAKVCLNCLRPGHIESRCNLVPCKYCKKKHNTLLHLHETETEPATLDSNIHTHTSSTEVKQVTTPRTVLLSTALVRVADSKGDVHTVRVLLDNGSTANFVSDSLCGKLGLSRRDASATVTGINNNTSYSTQSCSLTIISLYDNDFRITVDCHILPQVTKALPSSFINIDNIPLPMGISLADPSFNIPSVIDVLVGADIFWSVLCNNSIDLGKNQPKLYETKLGWLVSGYVSRHKSHSSSLVCNFLNEEADPDLSRFWELDSVAAKHSLSPEEHACEQSFLKNTFRKDDGRFVVTMPLKNDPSVLGDSFQKAKCRFLSLERKFQKDPVFRNRYVEFMQEYERLGHMSENKESLPSYLPHINYFLPHHGVIRESSLTTKLRTVFDASASITSKSKVAPIKPTTIPRLELCGALLAARLCAKVLCSLTLQVSKCRFWCDSTIVLGWLTTSPLQLKGFVRNRVHEIQESTEGHPWSYVSSKDNPADLVSRGVKADYISSSSLWWSGPSFLLRDEPNWPKMPNHPEKHDLPELISCSVVSTNISNVDPICSLINNTSNFIHLQKIIAYLQRSIYNFRNKSLKRTGHVSVTELKASLNLLLHKAQLEMFPDEYAILKDNRVLPKNNRLISLTPFLDSNNVIRVGGRLDNSPYSFDTKHPVLLCSKHHLTKILFEYFHLKYLHAGPQLLLVNVRQTYWPLGGRHLSKATVYKCVRCCRYKAESAQPIMGQLPLSRTELEYPFLHCSVDYAGPVLIADRKGRGCKLIKSYLAIFVCNATKACHIELVTALSSEAYIAALNRFVSRRGKPQSITSDNGTNFVGTCNEFSKVLAKLKPQIDLALEGIEFRFIPAYSPHFNGLAEAAVRSVKHHLQRLLHTTHFTYEEMATCLTQIEAVLNSRPLTPLSSDPLDYSALTPSHFLIGRPLNALPHSQVSDVNIDHINRLERFKRIEVIKKHFWDRFSLEYVTLLQQKVKWRSSKTELKLGSLVIIKDKALPPLLWHLGRIMKVYPGSDGICRVAEIKTKKGTIRRAFNNICPLPDF